MSGGRACSCEGTPPQRRKNWRVLQRLQNHSAFNGYRCTPSEWSSITCLRCKRCWRTKSAYVSQLADFKVKDEPKSFFVFIKASERLRLQTGVEGWADKGRFATTNEAADRGEALQRAGLPHGSMGVEIRESLDQVTTPEAETARTEE